MEELHALAALGLTSPSPAYIALAIVFGLIGLAAWRSGRKRENRKTLWLGVALMLYPYLDLGTGLLLAVGLALCAGLYFVRDRICRVRLSCRLHRPGVHRLGVHRLGVGSHTDRGHGLGITTG